jgi:hypothetical protein
VKKGRYCPHWVDAGQLVTALSAGHNISILSVVAVKTIEDSILEWGCYSLPSCGSSTERSFIKECK